MLGTTIAPQCRRVSSAAGRISRQASPLRHADGFQAPVLLFHGDPDFNVAVGHSRLMDERLRDAGKKQ